MIYYVGIAGGVIGLLAMPVIVYLCAKLGALGWHHGKQLFEEETQHRKEKHAERE